MGCVSSKQKRCRHCQSPYSPVPRSYSMNVHHPPLKKGDSYHIVALTSTTLGSLKPDQSNQNGSCNGEVVVDDDKEGEKEEDFSTGLMEAKNWSSMIQEKIPTVNPKTPIMTPPGEPETINTWELMEGLEDTSPFRSPNHFKSFSFNVAHDPNSAPMDSPNLRFQQPALAGSGLSFDLNCNAKKVNCVITDYKCAKEKEMQKVIVYFTSLRGIRRTYEDCCNVRVILKALGVRVDERDVSMHLRFKEELRELLGDGFSSSALPRVFVGRKCIGGAEEIRRMHEEGRLEKVVEGCEMVDDDGDGNGACEACGDVRFVPCETCSGSCKIYYESVEEEEEEEGEFGFHRCPDCNENGLIRCPICCY